VSPLRFVLRSLRYHWRTHLGAGFTAALVAAVIVAALGVGDSVRAGMKLVSGMRIGRVRFAAHAPDRLWRAALAGELAEDLGAPVSGTLDLGATLSRPDGSARVGGARVLGVDDAFWSLSPSGRSPLSSWPRDGALLSEAAAAALGVGVGDLVVVRAESPSMVPRDARLGPSGGAVVSLLVEVAAVLDAERFGAFAVRIGPVGPANVFLPLARLAEAVGEPDSINTLLTGDVPGGAERVREAVAGSFRIADGGLSVRSLGEGRGTELRSRRLFLEDAVAEAALWIGGVRGVLTWLVNDLAAGGRHTPYSMVAALPPGFGPVPGDLREDEIVVNSWLAGDLGVGAGDSVALTYYVLRDGGPLAEETASLRVRSVVPIAGAAADRDLMPAFPGIRGTESCRDWDPGLTLDLSRIRDVDEAYWREHEGTPKAFIPLTTGQRLWANRFGSLTAVRFPEGYDPVVEEVMIGMELAPTVFGLTFTDLPAAEAAARGQGMDFGALFLGFCSFLVAAALLLLGLVMALNVAMRRDEIATLLALGFTRARTWRLLALEHALVALAGGLLGIAGGVALQAAALAALGTVWSDVAGALPLSVALRPATLLAGALGGTLVSSVAAGLVLWRAVGRSPVPERAAPRRDSRIGKWAAPLLALAAGTVALLAGTGRDPATAGAFFGSGALLLVASILFAGRVLARPGKGRPSLAGFAWRNLGRRRGRSVAVAGVLAFGVFMFLGVTVFRRDRLASAMDRASGTGGFALVGESSAAVVDDLNFPEGRRAHGLSDADLAGARVVGLRLRSGDDASCRSLTRAQAPGIVGVDPADLRGRFTFVRAERGLSDPWAALDGAEGDGAVPAVIDQATVWTMGKGFGDRIALVDGEGRPFSARIAGVIDNSVLNGSLVVSERAFVRLFPGGGGHRRFLVEIPAERAGDVAAILCRQLADYGLSLERAEVKVNTLNAVENTYLGIFQALGGIGLLLGSIGLALVVGRNVLERRGELALLGAVGFPRALVTRLVTGEHAALLVLGLLSGLAASALSLLPALLSPGARVATPGMAAVILGLLIGGLLFTRLAVRAALRGPLLGNLRDE
jgi:hypothetical protein